MPSRKNNDSQFLNLRCFVFCFQFLFLFFIDDFDLHFSLFSSLVVGNSNRKNKPTIQYKQPLTMVSPPVSPTNTTASVQVVVRLRPLNDKEKKNSTLPVVSASTSDRSVTVLKGTGSRQVKTCYKFDNVFTAFSTQEDVFEATLKPVLHDVLNGYESTVFAYGQTGKRMIVFAVSMFLVIFILYFLTSHISFRLLYLATRYRKSKTFVLFCVLLLACCL